MGSQEQRQRQRLALPALGSSAGAARRFVTTMLRDLGLEHLTDAAALAVSELVTNAVLHSRTDIELVVSADEETVRVEVSDLGPALPVLRAYGSYATTGRGLGLVAALVHEMGVQPDEVGKTVWFTALVTPPTEGVGESYDDHGWDGDVWDGDAWDDGEGAGTTWDRGVRTEVPPGPTHRDHAVLVDLPVTLWLAARQYHDAALRELVLHRGTRTPPTTEAWAWWDAADTAHTALGAAVDRAVATALRSDAPPLQRPPGTASVATLPGALSVEVTVTDTLASGLVALQEALDDADRLATSGELLLRLALPEVVALRDWCCNQVVAQAGGGPPVPWREDLLATAEIAARQAVEFPQWDDTAVREAQHPVIAADDRNRIIAVSPAAEELLGWPDGDLLGRRVVEVVPPRLREAHIAGFTRHLVTGEAHALGVDLRLPVLHADGHEMLCDLVLERAPASAGRIVYLARIAPLPVLPAAAPPRAPPLTPPPARAEPGPQED